MSLEDIIGMGNIAGLKVAGSNMKDLLNSIRKKSLKIVPLVVIPSLALLVVYTSLAQGLAQGEALPTPTPTPIPAHAVYLPLLYKNAQNIFATPTPTPVLDSSDAFMSDFFYCDVNYTAQVKTIDSEVITEYYNAPNQVVLIPTTGTVLSVDFISGNGWKVRMAYNPVFNNRPYGSFISELTRFQTLDGGVKAGEILFAGDPIGFLRAEEPNLAHKFSRKDASGNFVSGNPSNFGGKNYWGKDPVYDRPICSRR